MILKEITWSPTRVASQDMMRYVGLYIFFGRLYFQPWLEITSELLSTPTYICSFDVHLYFPKGVEYCKH